MLQVQRKVSIKPRNVPRSFGTQIYRFSLLNSCRATDPRQAVPDNADSDRCIVVEGRGVGLGHGEGDLLRWKPWKFSREI